MTMDLTRPQHMGRTVRVAVVLLAPLLCATWWPRGSAAIAPARLVVAGSSLVDPSTGKKVRLTGFNWPIQHVHSGDGAFQRKLLPGANVARVVGLLWDNAGVGGGRGDCMSDVSPFITQSCLEKLDDAIRAATDAGVWAILTCRSKYGAGQDYSKPGTEVFHNSTLRSRFMTMWRAVAQRYVGWDRIAAYEILSEPRDKTLTAQEVRSFYEEGCAAVQAVDPRTPCMVGPGPYYKLYKFNSDIILRNNTNVIYTFDYFEPSTFSFGDSSVPQYPGVYPCSALYPGWSSTCCPNGASAPTAFNRTWHQTNLQKWALPLRSLGVPIYANQWGVIHGVAAEQGRYEYMSDLAQIFQSLDIGWSWWVWRGGGNGGTTWSHGSFEFVYYLDNGTALLDHEAIAAVNPYMSNTDSLF